ncbi:hypothetical protein QAD02_019885 [Eretmocerus hayati]|uniref:Uncharacterized protein n=1 Tax=Eretmocerus hayati TaxID=131215 RepID=A0ACC2PLY4_9HYME|nr:hypothetical protein QAD02_019885 [Eretmocerus hayati]
MAFKITIPSFLAYLLLVVHGSNGTHHGSNLLGVLQPPSISVQAGQDIHLNHGHQGSYYESHQASGQVSAHSSAGFHISTSASNQGQDHTVVHGHQHESYQSSGQGSALGSTGLSVSIGASNHGQAGQGIPSNYGHEVSHTESHQGSEQGSAQGSVGFDIHAPTQGQTGQGIHSNYGHEVSHTESHQGSGQGSAQGSVGFDIHAPIQGQTGQGIHSNYGHEVSHTESHQGSGQGSAQGSVGFDIHAPIQGQTGQGIHSNYGHEVSHTESHQGSGQGSAQGSVGFDIHAPIQVQAGQGIHSNYEHEVSYHGSHQGSGQGSVGIDHSINVSNQGNGQVNSGSSGYEASHPVLHHTSTGEVAHGGQASISVGVTKPDIFGALETIAGDIHHKVQDTKQKIADKLAHGISASVGTQVHGVEIGHSQIDRSNHHSVQSPLTAVAETSVHQNSQVSQGHVVNHPVYPLPENKRSYEGGVQINHVVQHVPIPSHGYPILSGHETSSGQTQSGVATSNLQGIPYGVIESHGSHGNFASSEHQVSAEGNNQGGIYKKNEVKINGPLINFQKEFSSSKVHQAGGNHNAGFGVSTGVSHQETVEHTNQAAAGVIIGSVKV